METKEEIKQRLTSKGFTLVDEYNDPAGAVFPDHDHPGDQLLVVVDGSIEIKMEGKTSILHKGDEIFFPAKVIHRATVGAEGCLYIVGEHA